MNKLTFNTKIKKNIFKSRFFRTDLLIFLIFGLICSKGDLQITLTQITLTQITLTQITSTPNRPNIK